MIPIKWKLVYQNDEESEAFYRIEDTGGGCHVAGLAETLLIEEIERLRVKVRELEIIILRSNTKPDGNKITAEPMTTAQRRE